MTETLLIDQSFLVHIFRQIEWVSLYEWNGYLYVNEVRLLTNGVGFSLLME